MARISLALCLMLAVASSVIYEAQGHFLLKNYLTTNFPAKCNEFTPYVNKGLTEFLGDLERGCPPTPEFKTFFTEFRSYFSFIETSSSTSTSIDTEMTKKCDGLFKAMSAISGGAAQKSAEAGSFKATMLSMGKTLVEQKKSTTAITATQKKTLVTSMVKWTKTIATVVKTASEKKGKTIDINSFGLDVNVNDKSIMTVSGSSHKSSSSSKSSSESSSESSNFAATAATESSAKAKAAGASAVSTEKGEKGEKNAKAEKAETGEKKEKAEKAEKKEKAAETKEASSTKAAGASGSTKGASAGSPKGSPTSSKGKTNEKESGSATSTKQQSNAASSGGAAASTKQQSNAGSSGGAAATTKQQSNAASSGGAAASTKQQSNAASSGGAAASTNQQQSSSASSSASSTTSVTEIEKETSQESMSFISGLEKKYSQKAELKPFFEKLKASMTASSKVSSTKTAQEYTSTAKSTTGKLSDAMTFVGSRFGKSAEMRTNFESSQEKLMKELKQFQDLNSKIVGEKKVSSTQETEIKQTISKIEQVTTQFVETAASSSSSSSSSSQQSQKTQQTQKQSMASSEKQTAAQQQTAASAQQQGGMGRLKEN